MNTILIINNDPNMQELIRLALKNHCSVQAADGRLAFNMLTHEKIDLAIIDVMLPYLDKIKLTEEIRSFLDIPILMVKQRVNLKIK